VLAPDPLYIAGVVDDVLEGLESTDRTRWRGVVHGAPTWGKSDVLRRVGDKLRDLKHAVLHLRPPLNARDTGLIAASQMSTWLRSESVIDDSLHHVIHDPSVTLQTKVALLRDVFEDMRDGVVVLIDDIDAWGAHRGDEMTEQPTAIAAVLMTLGRRVIITSSRGAVSQYGWTAIECRPRAGYQGWLLSDEWGELAGSARRLHGQLGSAVDSLSPLILRMLVMYADITSPESALEVIRHARSAGHTVPRSLHEAMSDDLGDVRRVWNALALVRKPIGEPLLAELDAPGADLPAGRMLRGGLLVGDESRYVLHNALRPAHAPPSAAEHHLRFSDHYIRRAQTESELSRFDSQLEAFHHASVALDLEAVSALQPLFAEQALIFTERLFECRRPRDADRYLRRIKPRLQPPRDRGSGSADTAQLHRDLALSADSNADARTAERHYRRALDIDARDPRIHGHFVCFLIDTGRVREAQVAWERAVAVLPNAADMDPQRLATLHAQVAWRLVRVNELNFAQDVLSGVPPWRIDELPSLRTVSLRLRAMRLAQRYGPVRPFALLVDGWWMTPPDDLPSAVNGSALRSWWAGRVSTVDEEGIVVDVAEVQLGAPDEEPVPGSVELTADALRNAGVSVPGAVRDGTFLVAGTYGEQRHVEIRIVTVPDTRVGLPRADLDPQRYLEAQRLVA
jgi:tetratricopeptide (TPR) repeat protein